VGWFRVTAAPAGRQAVIVVPEQASNGKVLLYEATRPISPLPIEAEYLAWSSDASKVYFFGGSTLEADAWKILGSLKLASLAIAKAKLPVPTEDINICPANGHIFAGIVPFDRKGHALPYAAAELDSELHFIARRKEIPPGRFSASCRFVASPGSFPHGPAPWEVVDAGTGRRVLQFEFSGEGKKPEEFQFNSWNPARESVLLRTAYRASGSKEITTDVQVFDIDRKSIVDSVRDIAGEAQWSRDGRSVIFSRGRALVIHPVFPQ
jgi:hypothetical protein